jgi:hypothetical protein
MNKATVLTTPDAIQFAHLAALCGALKLETLGMKRRGRSAYAIAKETHGLKGSKVKVYEQLKALKDEALRLKGVADANKVF